MTSPAPRGLFLAMNLDPSHRLFHTVCVIPVCPKCDTALLTFRYDTVEVDYCERCRGIWLDAGELDQFAGGPMPDFQSQPGIIPPGKKHLCPRCDTPMPEIHTAGNLKLDRCPKGHGLWFDDDEFRRLLAGTSLNAAFNQGETSP